MSDDNSLVRVAVLMSSYDGEKYITEQIESIINQKGVKVALFVRDDGSTDSTCSILEDYRKKGVLTWYRGKNMGPAKSFLELLYAVGGYEYYAFSDQDDFWMENKLEVAIETCSRFSNDKALLYYGRAKIVDSNLAWNGKYTKEHIMTTFSEAIIQSSAIGCTMVFNSALREVICKKKPQYVFMHDAWLHKACLVNGGNVFFDEFVPLLYRQHEGNYIGAQKSFISATKHRIKNLITKECCRSKQIGSLFECYGEMMNPTDKHLCDVILNYKNGFRFKMQLIFGNEILTKYKKMNLMFKLAILFNAF